jgi:23S rRNA maturation-related 3'-5' exoribonuclease YhaM
MFRKMIAAVAFAATLAPAAMAQTTTEVKFSTEKSTIGELLDNAEAKAAFVKVMPDIANHPDIEQGREMTLQAIADMGYADAKMFPELNAELAKIK